MYYCSKSTIPSLRLQDDDDVDWDNTVDLLGVEGVMSTTQEEVECSATPSESENSIDYRQYTDSLTSNINLSVTEEPLPNTSSSAHGKTKWTSSLTTAGSSHLAAVRGRIYLIFSARIVSIKDFLMGKG